MEDVKHGMRSNDDDVTPGDELSDAFEDAASEVALGPNNSTPELNNDTKAGEVEVEPEADDEEPVILSARLSKFITTDPGMFNEHGMAQEPELPPLPPQELDEASASVAPHTSISELPAPSHSRQVSSKTAPSPAFKVTKQGERVESTNIHELSKQASGPAELSAEPSVPMTNSAAYAPGSDFPPTPGTETLNEQDALMEHFGGQERMPQHVPADALSIRPESATVPDDISDNLAQASRRAAAPSKTSAYGSARQTTTEKVSPILEGQEEQGQDTEQEEVPRGAISPIGSNSVQTSPKAPKRGLSDDARTSAAPVHSSSEQMPPTERRGVSGRLRTASPPPNAGGLARRASTSFNAFLGRVGSIRRSGRSPPAPRQEGKFSSDRRSTSHNIVPMISNGDENLTPIADEPEQPRTEKQARRLTLQDQFQSLRQQEENNGLGISGRQVDGEDEEKTPTATRTFSDAGFEQPTSPSKAERSSSVPSVESTKPPRLNASLPPPAYRNPAVVMKSPLTKASLPSQAPLNTSSRPKSPTANASLPPGTAAGMAAGPADEPHPVNWDLWQSIVYEGPAVVANSSGDEMTQAIASGIPAAIRGVVWQVLTDSKSEELENMYWTLKTRGTSMVEQRESSGSAILWQAEPDGSVDGIAEKAEKESDASSIRSSTQSGHSTPATSNLASPPASIHGDEADLRQKLMAEKQKREAAALMKLEKTIRRDLGSRTSYSKYTQSTGLQDGLFGVCKAYALFDEAVGYAQGMNFIAMPLLFNVSEAEAFSLLVRLMNKYDVRSFFVADMPGLHLRLYQFERLLEDHDPALYCHLRRRHVEPKLYATQWFLTLFAYRFPLQLVLRVYDLVFSEGLTAILKFGLVLMQKNRDALLEMHDMNHLTNFLKERLFDAYIDKAPTASSLLDSGFFGSVTGGADKELYRADEMVRDACAVHISDATLAAYTTEWEDSLRLATEQAVQLESLRATNASLGSKVKELEERVLQFDAEHVTLAGDVVRYRVENDQLNDENEGLKIQVQELQKLIDAQPAEVEAKLQEEMGLIMKRNSEVQNENRRVKEEMEEMEHELVNAKMHCAHLQEDHDNLAKKWSTLQAMLSAK